ncbi:MAG: MBL fold metallo-hydrolase, partial [Nitrosopumilaceae archaeon]
MIVHQIQVGNMQNFTYIVEDEDSSEAIIIDPSWDLVELELVIKRNNLKIKYIVNTHHHFDHTLGNEAMAKSTGAKIIQHEDSTLSHDIAVSQGDKIKFGNSELSVIHTPGHSKDS